MNEHRVVNIAEFTTRVVRFDSGLAVHESVSPYWRWYCACGSVGGRRSSREAALQDFKLHVAQEAP